MTTYNGETLTPVKATVEQTDILNRILRLKADAKEIYKELDELVRELPTETPLVAEVKERKDDGFTEQVIKTFVIDKPKGHYVSYKELDLTMNAKTTKKDLKELGLD